MSNKLGSAENQLWNVQNKGAGTIAIIPKSIPSYALDAGKMEHGGPVMLLPHKEKTHSQQWKINKKRIVPLYKNTMSSKLVLHIDEINGARVILWTSNDGSNQKFEFGVSPFVIRTGLRWR